MKKTVGFAVDLRTSVPMHVSVHCFTFNSQAYVPRSLTPKRAELQARRSGLRGRTTS